MSFLDDAITASRTRARLAGCTCTPIIEAHELTDGAYVHVDHQPDCTLTRRHQARSN